MTTGVVETATSVEATAAASKSSADPPEIFPVITSSAASCRALSRSPPSAFSQLPDYSSISMCSMPPSRQPHPDQPLGALLAFPITSWLFFSAESPLWTSPEARAKGINSARRNRNEILSSEGGVTTLF
jgi:hypothetical protein